LIQIEKRLAVLGEKQQNKSQVPQELIDKIEKLSK
jgi:hypothetical protein